MRNTLNKLIRRVSSKSIRILDRVFTSRQRVAFIHIPKCAGKSVAAAIHNAMGSMLEPWINSRDARQAVHSVFPGGGPDEIFEATPLYRRYLLAYFLQSGRKLIYGHLPVGLELVEEFKKEVAFVTVLRNPVARWKSNYIYDKINNDDPFSPPYRDSGRCLEEELDEILGSVRGVQLAYVPTMMLTGKFPASLREAEYLSGRVIETLRNFAVVGFTDDLASFSLAFERATGSKIYIPRKNITSLQFSADNAALYKDLSALFEQPKITRSIEKLCEVEQKTFQALEKEYR